MVVNLCRWGWEGLVRGLGLDQPSDSLTRKARDRDRAATVRNGKDERVGLNSA